MSDQNDRNPHLAPTPFHGSGRKLSASSVGTDLDSGYVTSLARSRSTQPSSVSGDEGPSAPKFRDPFGGLAALPSSSVPEQLVHYGKLVAPSAIPQTTYLKNHAHSKTSLGRMTYTLKDLPVLFIAEITTLVQQQMTSPTAEGWELVKSIRIRRKVIDDLLSRSKLGRLSNYITFDIGARGTRDHLITTLMLGENFLKEQLTHDRIIVGNVWKRAKRADPNNNASQSLDQQIAREISGPSATALGDKEQANLYWRSLDLLIRKYASQSMYSAGDQISTEFVQELPNTTGHSNKIDPFEGLEPEPSANVTSRKTPEFGTGLLLGLRIHPSLNGEHKRLHLDFDVVPHIPIGPLLQVLSNILGLVDFKENPDHYVPVLKDMLKGIHVRCLYAPRSKQVGGSLEILAWETIERGRRFQIKEVRRARKVPEFEMNGQSYSVASYFNSKFTSPTSTERRSLQTLGILPDGMRLAYPELPLVSDGKDHWVPLELLCVERPQAILGCKRLALAAKKKVPSILDQSYTPKLQECGHRFIHHLAVPNLHEVSSLLALCWSEMLIKLQDGPEKKPLFEFEYHGFISNSQSLLQEPTPDRTKKDMTNSQNALHNVTIVDADRSDAAFVSKVKAGLVASEPKPDTVKSFTIESVADLAKQKLSTGLDNVVNGVSAKVANKEKPTIPKPQAILGISNGLHSFAEELHKLGEFRSGVVVLNAKRNRLDKSYTADENKDKDHYFPSNIRFKLNYMAGGTNFDTGALGAVLKDIPTRLMIVGAHVKYTDISAKTGFCPSIAAVVASTDTSAVHYPGSIRLQQQFKLISPANPKDRQPETMIETLPIMMQERFRAWKDNSSPPNAVLFYRDSVNFDDKVVKTECEEIKNAYRRVFPNAPALQLAYVVVNKNAHLTPVEPVTPPRLSAEEEKNAPVSPIMDFGLEAEADGKLNKYKYYVIENTIGLAKETLADLVSPAAPASCLNFTNNEIDSQTQQELAALPAKRCSHQSLASDIFPQAGFPSVQLLSSCGRHWRQQAEIRKHEYHDLSDARQAEG
jgi:hypothetical protein